MICTYISLQEKMYLLKCALVSYMLHIFKTICTTYVTCAIPKGNMKCLICEIQHVINLWCIQIHLRFIFATFHIHKKCYIHHRCTFHLM